MINETINYNEKRQQRIDTLIELVTALPPKKAAYAIEQIKYLVGEINLLSGKFESEKAARYKKSTEKFITITDKAFAFLDLLGVSMSTIDEIDFDIYKFMVKNYSCVKDQFTKNDIFEKTIHLKLFIALHNRMPIDGDELHNCLEQIN